MGLFCLGEGPNRACKKRKLNNLLPTQKGNAGKKQEETAPKKESRDRVKKKKKRDQGT